MHAPELIGEVRDSALTYRRFHTWYSSSLPGYVQLLRVTAVHVPSHRRQRSAATVSVLICPTPCVTDGDQVFVVFRGKNFPRRHCNPVTDFFHHKLKTLEFRLPDLIFFLALLLLYCVLQLQLVTLTILTLNVECYSVKHLPVVQQYHWEVQPCETQESV